MDDSSHPQPAPRDGSEGSVDPLQTDALGPTPERRVPREVWMLIASLVLGVSVFLIVLFLIGVIFGSSSLLVHAP